MSDHGSRSSEGSLKLSRKHLQMVAEGKRSNAEKLKSESLSLPQMRKIAGNSHSKLHNTRWNLIHAPIGPMPLRKIVGGIDVGPINKEEAKEEWDANYLDRLTWATDPNYHLMPFVPQAIVPNDDIQVATVEMGESGGDGTMIHGKVLTLAYARQLTTPQKCAVKGNLRGLRECVTLYNADVNKVDEMVSSVSVHCSPLV
jgi:hypothetical protein